MEQHNQRCVNAHFPHSNLNPLLLIFLSESLYFFNPNTAQIQTNCQILNQNPNPYNFYKEAYFTFYHIFTLLLLLSVTIMYCKYSSPISNFITNICILYTSSVFYSIT